MLTMEYDYATDIAAQREEAMEIGLEQGLERGMEMERFETAHRLWQMNLSAEDISRATGLPIETVLEQKN